jgi:hypothetical protein
MEMKPLFVIAALCILTFSSAVNSKTYCDSQLEDLKAFALVAKYEQLPQEQKANYIAQLTSDERIGLMALQSSHQLGAALNKSLGIYSDSVTDSYNKKFEVFKTKCGFMLK